MFKRIVLEDWQNIVPFFSFGAAFLIFLFGVAVALLSKKEKIDEMAQMPLESNQDNANHPH